jgi:hypothetical protein
MQQARQDRRGKFEQALAIVTHKIDHRPNILGKIREG